MRLARREFIRSAAVAAGGLAAATAAEAQIGTRAPGSLPQRTLGRTRRRVSTIGIGMAPLGSANTSFAEAAAVVEAALDLGVTYIDVSPDYGDAEAKLKGVLKTRRDGLFLVTKVNPRGPEDRDIATRQGVQTQIEESLRRMGVAHIDLVHIHNLGDFDMQRLFAPDGAIAGLKEARRRGLIGHIGISGHMRPPRFVTAIETGDIDVAMVALNFADRNHYDFEGLVLPAARKHGTAVVAMKVLGGAQSWRYDGRTPATLARYHEQAVRYALGLPGVSCAVIGFSSSEEARQAAEVAKRFRPLSGAARESLLAEGRELARERGLYYGPVTG